MNIGTPEFYSYLKENKLDGQSILLCGVEKSGNTWVRFVIFNYFHLVKCQAEQTLSFEKLNSISRHRLDLRQPININEKLPDRNDFIGTMDLFTDGFPIFYNTHAPYREELGLFACVIYVHRHPLDVMVSNYYFWLNRKVPFDAWPEDVRDQCADIDKFVLATLPYWIKFHQVVVSSGKIKVCYERALKDPYGEFETLFHSLGIKPDPVLLKKSIDFSSFERISEMAKKKNQIYGNSDPNNFTGTFMRSGKVGQYMNLLRPETIDLAISILKKSGLSKDIIDP